MTGDTRQVIVRRLFEAGWNSGNAALVSDIIDASYTSNDGGFYRTGADVPGGLEQLTGVDAFADHVRQYREMYSDLCFTIDIMVTDGDTVMTLWTPVGTSRDQTFTNRAGRKEPYELRGQGMSRTDVVDQKVTRHDMFWARSPLFP